MLRFIATSALSHFRPVRRDSPPPSLTRPGRPASGCAPGSRPQAPRCVSSTRAYAVSANAGMSPPRSGLLPPPMRLTARGILPAQGSVFNVRRDGRQVNTSCLKLNSRSRRGWRYGETSDLNSHDFISGAAIIPVHLTQQLAAIQITEGGEYSLEAVPPCGRCNESTRCL
jgi:hypothetical protein